MSTRAGVELSAWQTLESLMVVASLENCIFKENLENGSAR
jgi:hypothetical protein